VCAVDPGNVVTESNEGNNSCSDTVVVGAPDLTAVKTDTVSNATTLGNSWTWKVHVANGGTAVANFANGNTVLTDNLPSTNIGYGSASMSNASGITGTINCAIASNTLTCTAGNAVAIAAAGGFDVSFTATPTAIGTYANPTGGTCAVDPGNVVVEGSEANNSCNDTVVVTAPDLTVAKTHNPATFVVNDVNDTITITVTNNGGAPSTGTVTVTDNLPAGLTFNGSPTAAWNCSANGVNPVVCTSTNAIVGSGGTLALVLNVNVASSTGSPLANNVAVQCTCTESNTGNNAGSDSIPVSQVIGITLATASPTGLLVSADGGSNYFPAPHTFPLVPGSHPTIVTQSPQAGPAGTQYVWVSWSDAGAVSHSITTPGVATTYTATFKTQYLLTTAVSPNASEGSISPATGYVDAGSIVPVTGTPNTGYVFTGFSGGLSGVTNPQNITVSAPVTVTANFQPGPTALGGSFGVKSGPFNARVWPVNIGNNGPGVALGAQVTAFTVVQTSPGTPCTPVVVTPMPAVVGDIAPGGTKAASVTVNFTGCGPVALFTVTATVNANNGVATGTIQKLKQLQ
jgi:uncharacterized repeat protein (TIGR01451 family)